MATRLKQVERTLVRNIYLCNPDLVPDDSELPDKEQRAQGCNGTDQDAKKCSILEVT